MSKSKNKQNDIYLRPVSSQGQVTIPLVVRDKLQLAKSKSVIFDIQDDKVILRAPEYTLDDVYGILEPLGISDDEMRRIAREERMQKHLD